MDFVQKKRDDVSFSPLDHTSADSFLQVRVFLNVIVRSTCNKI